MPCEFAVAGTEAGTGNAASWGAIPPRVEEERAGTGEDEGEDAQTDNREDEP